MLAVQKPEVRQGGSGGLPRLEVMLHQPFCPSIVTLGGGNAAFGTIDAVPSHGVSVGIGTITSARKAALVLTGKSKRDSLSRVTKAESYDPDWPATVIHEFTNGEIIADREAAEVLG